MPTPLTISQAQSVSTHANPTYQWSTFLAESSDPVLGAWVDPLTVDMSILLDSSKLMSPVTITENMPITTVSYNLYGTTSLWSVILYLNGFMHPDELPPGTTLIVPSRNAVDSIINKNKLEQSNYGKQFVV